MNESGMFIIGDGDQFLQSTLFGSFNYE